MARRPIIRRCALGISDRFATHCFIFSGNAKYGRPSTIKTRPSKQKSVFIEYA